MVWFLVLLPIKDTHSLMNLLFSLWCKNQIKVSLILMYRLVVIAMLRNVSTVFTGHRLIVEVKSPTLVMSDQLALNLNQGLDLNPQLQK